MQIFSLILYFFPWIEIKKHGRDFGFAHNQYFWNLTLAEGEQDNEVFLGDMLAWCIEPSSSGLGRVSERNKQTKINLAVLIPNNERKDLD